MRRWMLIGLALVSSGCWSVQRSQYLSSFDNAPDLQLCFLNNGIPPEEVRSCYADAQDQDDVTYCLTKKFSDRREAFQRCTLAGEAAQNARTQTTWCRDYGVLGTECKSY